MNVLIYTGYQKEAYNSNTLKEKGLGGTEQCCIYLAKYLKNFGWNIIIGGEVIEDTIDSIQWMRLETIHKKMYDKFDVIIGASYIHFLEEFRDYNCQKIFWAHNTDYFPWWQGKEIKNHLSLLTDKSLNKTVCLTNWHKKQWSTKYNIPIKNIEVIGNGVEVKDFKQKIKKQPGKIIWSSAPERGLTELLDNWHKIKSIIPHAELHIFTPSYSIESYKQIKLMMEGVYFRGNVTPDKLHQEMLSSEYWFYLTDYRETYCITAIEMQLAKVFPIVTDVAALKENVINGIVLPNNENKWQHALNCLYAMDSQLKNKIININSKLAKEKTWLIKSLDWKNLIKKL